MYERFHDIYFVMFFGFWNTDMELNATLDSISGFQAVKWVDFSHVPIAIGNLLIGSRKIFRPDKEVEFYSIVCTNYYVWYLLGFPLLR